MRAIVYRLASLAARVAALTVAAVALAAARDLAAEGETLAAALGLGLALGGLTYGVRASASGAGVPALPDLDFSPATPGRPADRYETSAEYAARRRAEREADELRVAQAWEVEAAQVRADQAAKLREMRARLGTLAHLLDPTAEPGEAWDRLVEWSDKRRTDQAARLRAMAAARRATLT